MNKNLGQVHGEINKLKINHHPQQNELHKCVLVCLLPEACLSPVRNHLACAASRTGRVCAW